MATSKFMMFKFLVSLATVLLALVPQAKAAWFDKSAPIMGTRVYVNVWHEDQKLANEAMDHVLSVMRGIDERLSPYKPDSDLSRLNQTAANKPVVLTGELLLLLERSQWAYSITDGAFDITFASVGRLYDYREKRLPSPEQIKRLLPALSTKHLAFDKVQNTLRFLHPDVALDLGGIAKGYAVDLAIESLKQQGIRHAYVSAGGDSRALGNRGDRPWLIGIKHPRRQANDDAKTVITLPVDNLAVSTSGDYERYFIDEKSGDRIHHIINPKTGASAGGVMSVTVMGPEGLTTDPLSTAIFVLGVEKGLKLIHSIPHYDAIIIDSAGQVHYSNGLMPSD